MSEKLTTGQIGRLETSKTIFLLGITHVSTEIDEIRRSFRKRTAARNGLLYGGASTVAFLATGEIGTVIAVQMGLTGFDLVSRIPSAYVSRKLNRVIEDGAIFLANINTKLAEQQMIMGGQETNDNLHEIVQQLGRQTTLREAEHERQIRNETNLAESEKTVDTAIAYLSSSTLQSSLFNSWYKVAREVEFIPKWLGHLRAVKTDATELDLLQHVRSRYMQLLSITDDKGKDRASVENIIEKLNAQIGALQTLESQI